MANYIEEPVRVRLRQEQFDALQAVARQRNTTIVDLIRQSVDTLLANVPENVPDLIRQQTPEPWPEGQPVERDPLYGFVGLGNSGVGNLAEEHDRYIAETVHEESHPCPVKSS